MQPNTFYLWAILLRAANAARDRPSVTLFLICAGVSAQLVAHSCLVC
jgi:hypothetical protein